ncbi:cation-translocating P-type ATPase [Cloacibacillus sp. An23]|uniref:heavy metal translocating P-type ATPase n=1 Tax=Cloacibacillus sp. An23 TaxID=1965591 RepID=UPI000B3A4D4C|nr:cation-translocating P-type ATPase [Cloacibacillus sp. An23]OUO93434.1 copper-translocating P-type ATPase [Cloacibacillus sp. An23]
MIEKLEKLLEWGGVRRDAAFLAISGAALAASFFGYGGLPFDPAWIAIVLCGAPIILEAFIGLVTAFDVKADLLVSMALAASVSIGEDFAAGEVAFIMQIGALLEDLTVAKARAGIEKLVRLTPRTARVLRGGAEAEIPAEEVAAGDVLRVLPGETIPADGVVLDGQTSVDQSVMTGEPMPVDKGPGDEVSSGTINQYGGFTMKATRAGGDSSFQRMVRLVQSADAGKAKIVRLADRWAAWIVAAALVSALAVWLVTGEAIRGVTILVVFCPCALVLATPTAIMAAVGNCTRYGVLVREGDALERLAQIKKIAFDKTGTLTYGKPSVAAVRSFAAGVSDTELLSLAASAELRSEHPLGRALVGRARAGGVTVREPDGFSMLPGLGVEASVTGRDVLAGNEALLARRGVSVGGEIKEAARGLESEGAIIVWLALDGRCAGFAAFSDEMRPGAPDAVRRLKKLGVSPVLLSGDRSEAVARAARLAGIEETRCECRPEDKINAIKGFQAAGAPVCMVGDGVNDAPALRAAYAGIAMGGVGSDIAVESAGVVLVGDDTDVLPRLFALSRRMMTTIKLNMAFSMTLNFAAIALAAAGILNPVAGALVHNAGSVLVIINSSLLLKWKRTD